ncbi:MAG TPA: TIGR03668 family PPOX class F420-dependent oxidoreductase [Candidatus Limnocylindrales bacterium]|nr:TIGR03668 family PPOX class F420-dependent oxidoreductase [Candidatus Limnocylindrales bacterium]
MQDPILTGPEHEFVAASRRAVLATIRPDGEPRLVPVCFYLADAADEQGRPIIYSPIDEKPKASPDPRRLARVQDLLVLPAVTLLIDRWSEDWTHLGWIRLTGRGVLLEPEPREVEEHAAAVAALRAKYPQYAGHDLEHRPVIRMAIDRVQRWGDLSPDEPAGATGGAGAAVGAAARAKGVEPPGS